MSIGHHCEVKMQFGDYVHFQLGTSYFMFRVKLQTIFEPGAPIFIVRFLKRQFFRFMYPKNRLSKPSKSCTFQVCREGEGR